MDKPSLVQRFWAFVLPPKGSPKGQIREWIETIVVAGVIALIIRTFILQIFYIPSGSMIPTLLPKDRIIGLMFTYRFREPQRYDVIIFKYPEDRSKNFVKRLIGLPGETVKIRAGQVLVNDKPLDMTGYTLTSDDAYFGPVEVPSGNYFVLGDNRPNSADSRFWGFLPRENVMGTGWFRIWPPTRMGFYK